MEEKEIMQDKIESKEKTNKVLPIVIIICVVALIAIFVICKMLFNTDNLNDTKTCKYNTGIEKYDEELYNYYIENNICGSPVYISKEQLENYGFGQNVDFDNIDEFTNYLVGLLHEGASFDEVTEIDETLLFNVLSQYLNSGNCGWYKKSLYTDAYKYIFGDKKYDVESLISKHSGYETDNFVQVCNGIGSVISAQFADKKINDDQIIYTYTAQFYPVEENSDNYEVVVEYKKLNEKYYLSKISINAINKNEQQAENNEEYYQFYKEYPDGSHTTYELKLTQDRKAKYCVWKANAGSFCEEGTYSTIEDKITFNGRVVSGVNQNEDITRTFIKENNTIYEEKVYSMTKTNKENLKLIKE